MILSIFPVVPELPDGILYTVHKFAEKRHFENGNAGGTIFE